MNQSAASATGSDCQRKYEKRQTDYSLNYPSTSDALESMEMDEGFENDSFA